MSLGMSILFALLSVVQGSLSHEAYMRGDHRNGRIMMMACAVFAHVSAVMMCNWISHE